MKAQRTASFGLPELEGRQAAGGRPYLEFLKVPTLSTGLYHLAAGAIDQQQPHEEDEVYYVIRGRAQFTADGKEEAVGPGSVLFVAAGVEHRFYDIEEDLQVLVFFAAGS